MVVSSAGWLLHCPEKSSMYRRKWGRARGNAQVGHHCLGPGVWVRGQVFSRGISTTCDTIKWIWPLIIPLTLFQSTEIFVSCCCGFMVFVFGGSVQFPVITVHSWTRLFNSVSLVGTSRTVPVEMFVKWGQTRDFEQIVQFNCSMHFFLWDQRKIVLNTNGNCNACN